MQFLGSGSACSDPDNFAYHREEGGKKDFTAPQGVDHFRAANGRRGFGARLS